MSPCWSRRFPLLRRGPPWWIRRAETSGAKARASRRPVCTPARRAPSQQNICSCAEPWSAASSGSSAAVAVRMQCRTFLQQIWRARGDTAAAALEQREHVLHRKDVIRPCAGLEKVCHPCISVEVSGQLFSAQIVRGALVLAYG